MSSIGNGEQQLECMSTRGEHVMAAHVTPLPPSRLAGYPWDEVWLEARSIHLQLLHGSLRLFQAGPAAAPRPLLLLTPLPLLCELTAVPPIPHPS